MLRHGGSQPRKEEGASHPARRGRNAESFLKEYRKKGDNDMEQVNIDQLFYGNVIESAGIIQSLIEILFGSGDKSTEEQYATSFYFYNQVWLRKHGAIDPLHSATSYIEEAMKNHYADFSNAAVEKAVDKCLKYIFEHEPYLNDDATLLPGTPDEMSNYPYRFLINYRQGVKQFNQEKYAEAVACFTKCLAIKEDDANARFEIAEAYMRMGLLVKAEETLQANVPYISRKADKAKLFRRIGFIRIVKSEYRLATALLLYSWLIEENSRTIQDLQYIGMVTGRRIRFSRFEVVSLLKENGLLFWMIFDVHMSAFDYYIRTIVPGKIKYDPKDLSPEEITRWKLLAALKSQETPSEQFVSGALFDLSRSARKYFIEAIHSESDAMELLKLIMNLYEMFLDQPQLVELAPFMVDRNKNDTNPLTWNTSVFELGNGDFAALLYMPIENDILAARIAGIIFSDGGDGYYYCMLNKDSETASVVKRNMALFMTEDIGEVKGFGFSLMNGFLDCIKADFYHN